MTVRPMMAKVGELPAGDGWQYEIKWDGFRCVATVKDGVVTMQSRSAKTELSDRFPNVARDLATLPDCVIDGEVVVFDEDGFTFGIPAADGRAGSLVAFDVLEDDGESVRHLPLRERRQILKRLLHDAPESLGVSPAFDDGEQLLGWCAERGLEGIVAKRTESRYAEGTRRGEWLKIKLRVEQEFVVCGWTDGKNGRTGRIGGLVLGYWDDGVLRYAGRTGSRDDHESLLRERLVAGDCPLTAGVPGEERGAHWVEPTEVVQVAFQRWTDDGRLWHPIFQRMRDDKDAADVVRET